MMRIYFVLIAIAFLTLSLAFAQDNQDFNNLNATNLNVTNLKNATSQNAPGLAANFIGLESSSSKAVYDIGSFARIKPVYDMSLLSRTIKPVFDVSQRAGQPARFSYTMGVIKPTFNVSQRGGQLTRFTYNVGIMKPIYNVSAYSAIKPLYDIGQFSRTKPIYPLSMA
jgi:hypothetical protein